MAKCALIGNPVSHSKSPALFAAAYGTGKHSYSLIEAPTCKEAMDIFRAEGFTGTNVTSPFKDEIMDYTDLPDSISSILGSANTIISTNGKLYSYNTDYFGVKNTLEAFLPAAGNTGAKFCAPEDAHPHLRNTGAQFCAPEELTALVVGAGGAGKAAALALKDMGMEVYFANRSSSAAKPFAQKIGAEYVTLDHIPLLLPKADIVVYNLSMEIDPLKGVSLADKIVFEANYAHPNLACKESKIYIDGRYWLYNQAIPAFRLFTGEEPDATAMAQVLGL
jgi:shikimate dehydrogenase